MANTYELIPFYIKTEANGANGYHSLSYESTHAPEELEHHLSRLFLATLGVNPVEHGVVWFNEAGVMNAIPEREEMLRVIVRPHLRITVRAVDQYKKGRYQDLFDITLFSSIPMKEVRFLTRTIHSLFFQLDYGNRSIAMDYDDWVGNTIHRFLVGISQSLGLEKAMVWKADRFKYRSAEEVFDFLREKMDFTFELVVREVDSEERLPVKGLVRRWLHSDQPFYRPQNSCSREEEEAIFEEDIRRIEEFLREKQRLYDPAVTPRATHRSEGMLGREDEVDPSILTHLSSEMRDDIFGSSP